MNARNNVGRVSPILLVLLACGFFFGTYNLLTLVLHKASTTSDSEEWGDPVITRKSEGVKVKNSAKFHVAVTATDAVYIKWQCRIMYYWYKKMKKEPGSDMGGFTRVLHSGKPDDLMEEMNTFVVDPLPEGLDQGYVVLNRPWAFVQWLEKATIEEEYILMAEPDHIIVNPLPNLANGDYPAAFPFFYITPSEEEKHVRKYYPKEKGPITDVDPIGNSPVIIKKTILEKIAPTWMDVSLRMKEDPETDEAFDWVLEMYAYAVASALHGVRHILRKHGSKFRFRYMFRWKMLLRFVSMKSKTETFRWFSRKRMEILIHVRKDFMIQPPWDLEVGKNFIIHYTYGCDYNMKGELTYGKIGEWRFDKRSYTEGPMPRNLTLPPPGVPESVVRLVESVNEATANIPNWDTQ